MITKAYLPIKEQDVVAIPELWAILDAWEYLGISGLSNVNPQIKALSGGETSGDRREESRIHCFDILLNIKSNKAQFWRDFVPHLALHICAISLSRGDSALGRARSFPWVSEGSWVKVPWKQCVRRRTGVLFTLLDTSAYPTMCEWVGISHPL